MKKQLLVVFAFVFCQAQAQTEKLWAPHNGGVVTKVKNAERVSFPENFKLYQVNVESLKMNLNSAEDRFASNKKGVFISLPNVNGNSEKFEVFEASNFEPELQAQFPDIRAYAGKSLTDANAQLRLSISPNGIQATIFRAGSGTEIIEPYSADGKIYAVYNSKNGKGKAITCSTIDEQVMTDDLLNRGAELARSNDQKWHVFKLAMSCTGEYATFHGGTAPLVLAAFNNTMTRVNGVFEKEFGIHMNLIPTTTNVIYLNAAGDPYGPDDTNYNAELQGALTAQIGEANYDIGHLVSAIGNNGNAGCIGCVCVDGSKGSGYTTSTSPIGDNFDIDFVAHEMGHQFGGNHTFTFSTENNTVNVEPGSGSSIMGYAGITGAYDVQPHSDDYFTYRSILQIQTNMATKTCQVTTTHTNPQPVVNAGAAMTLPRGTPFMLTGSGSDANGITFCWEQNNDATTVGGNAGYVLSTKTNGPNFRSFDPVATPVRYFPSLSNLANNTTTWEVVPSVARTLTFTLTGRDNAVGQYQTSVSSVAITFSGTVGPLDVTSQATEGQNWLQGSSQTITWAVNGTNTTTALGGSANVDILLSTDGGLTYPTTLIAGTPNDGTQAITVPNVAAPNCRVMVKASTHAFFDINREPIAIGYTVANTCNTYTNNTAIAIPDGVGTTGPALGAIVTRTVAVPVTYNITDIDVNVAVTHTYVNDLLIAVNHPDATQVMLWNGYCADQDNFNITFDDNNPIPVCTGAGTAGSFAPIAPLAALNGKPANGTYTLLAGDAWAGDTGSITNFAVTVCSQVLTLSNPDFEFADFNLYPNPNNGDFTVKFTSVSTNDIKVNVHDMRGRQVYEKSFSNTGAFNQNINLSKVQAGIYLVSIIDGAKKTVKRIVVE